MTKIKIPFVAILFAIATIAATIIRYMQYSKIISVESGFFTHDSGFLRKAYYLLLIGTVIGFIVLYFFDRKRGCGIIRMKSASPRLSLTSSVIGAALTVFCGFLICLEVFYASQEKYTIIQSVAMVLASLGFTFTGFIVFTQRKIRPINAIAFLFISAGFVSIAALMFMQKIYTVNLSARLISMLIYLLLSVFFLSIGRILVRRESRFTSLSATICGYLLVLISISDGLARIFYYLNAGNVARLDLLEYDNGFDLPTALFIAQSITVLWLIHALSVKKRNDEGHNDDNEQEEV